MKKLICYLAVLSLVTSSLAIANQTKEPTYENYPVKDAVYQGKPSKLDVKDHKEAKFYRIRLKQALHQPVNFAGHYIVTSWGCGTFCLKMAIIDAKTGKVYLPKIQDHESHWKDYLIGWNYEKTHANSKLLKVTAQLSTLPRSNQKSLNKPYRYEKIYYLWEKNQLVKISSSNHH